MKKTFTLIILLGLCQLIIAQEKLGINTVSPEGALDVSSSNEGVLVPRVALSSMSTLAPLATPAAGELVYNTATAGSGNDAVTPGFYFWNGTAWSRLKAGITDEASLTMNGTDLSISGGNTVDLSDMQDHGWYIENSTNFPTAIGNHIYTNGSVGIGVMDPPERLSVYRNTNTSAEIGFAHVGYIGHNGWAGFSHVDANGTGQYALLQNGAGQTLLNSANGQAILFRRNNVNVGTFDTNGDFGVGTSNPDSKVEVVGDVRLNGINSGVIYESKETHKDWRLVYYDSFEGGTEGWISNGSLSTGNAGLIRENMNVAGLVGHFIRPNNNDNTLKKNFDLSGMAYSEVKVEFNYIFLDSWDIENGWVGVKGGENSNPTPVWVRQHGHDMADLELNGTTYNISFYGNSGWSDLKVKSEVQFSWSGGGFWIEFGANLDSDIGDETFGIDNIAVYVR